MKRAKNVNPHQSWKEYLWTLTSFLPSLQLMFIFGLLLSTEAQRFGKNQTPYQKLLQLCESYTPSTDFNEVHNLLMVEGKHSNLITHPTEKRNPLTIAQETENVDLAKLVLDATGTLYCSEQQQATIPKETPKYNTGKLTIPNKYNNNKLSIALHMLEAGCKLERGLPGDHNKYINGIPITGVMASLSDYKPAGFSKPLSVMLLTSFFKQLNANDDMDAHLIVEATQIAMYLYSNNINERGLKLVILHFFNLLTRFDLQEPSNDFYQLITAANNFSLKTVNFLLQFIATSEQLNAYIKLASKNGQKNLLDSLNKIKASADIKLKGELPDEVDPAETQTILYRRTRIEYWIAQGDLEQLKKELLIFDNFFGKYSSCQVYVVVTKVIVGQLKEAKEIMLKLANERQDQGYQYFIDFIESISKPHPLSIEGFQPPALSEIPLNKSEILSQQENLITKSQHASQTSLALKLVAAKINNQLTEMLKAVTQGKNKSDKEKLLAPLLEEIKKIDSHLLYYLEPTLAEISLQAMLLANTMEESFRYFKMAVLLDPAIVERIFANSNSKNNFLIFASYNFIKIFSQKYPDQMYNYSQRKLLDYARLGYTTTQLDGFLNITKTTIDDYYQKTTTPNNIDLTHLYALLTMSIKSGKYSSLAEEIILNEIKTLQQRKLLEEKFKLGNQEFTLETLQFEFSKLRPLPPSVLPSRFSWRQPGTLIGFIIGTALLLVYNNILFPRMANFTGRLLRFLLLKPIIFLLYQVRWKETYYISKALLGTLTKVSRWSNSTRSERMTIAQILPERFGFHYRLHEFIRKQTGLITSIRIDNDLNVISEVKLPTQLSTKTWQIDRTNKDFVPEDIILTTSLILSIAKKINQEYFPQHVADFTRTPVEGGFLLVMCSTLNLHLGPVYYLADVDDKLPSIDVKIQELLITNCEATIEHNQTVQKQRDQIIQEQEKERKKEARERGKEQSIQNRITEIKNSNTQALAHKENINTSLYTSTQRIEDYKQLKAKIDQELPQLPHSARMAKQWSERFRKITTSLEHAKSLSPLTLPDFSKTSPTEYKSELQSQKENEQKLNSSLNDIKSKHAEIISELEELKNFFKANGKKFEFEWSKVSSPNVVAPSTDVATITPPQNLLHLLITNDNDDGDDPNELNDDDENNQDDPEEAQSTRSNNDGGDDDDNDNQRAELASNDREKVSTFLSPEPSDEELLNKFLSEEERKLQFVLAPSHWGRQVNNSTIKTSSSSSSSSSSKDVVGISIPDKYRELVQNAHQLCNDIANAVQPFANENIDDATRRKCIHQLTDLSARYYLALIRLAIARVIPSQGLIRDVSSIRHALRHNTPFFIHSTDAKLNRAIYDFGRSQRNLLQAALAQEYTLPKNSLLGILAHSETESKLSTDQLSVALRVEFEFLNEQLSKPDVTIASLERELPGFCAGFLTYIGNFMHESHNRASKQATALITTLDNTPFVKIQDGTANNLSQDELYQLSTGNLLYLCWELRNIRGHESNAEPFLKTYELMRAVVSKLDQFNAQLLEVEQNISEAMALH